MTETFLGRTLRNRSTNDKSKKGDLIQQIITLIAEIKQGHGNVGQLLIRALTLMSEAKGLGIPDLSGDIYNAYVEGVCLKRYSYVLPELEQPTSIQFFNDCDELIFPFNQVFNKALGDLPVTDQEIEESLLPYLDQKKEIAAMKLRAELELKDLAAQNAALKNKFALTSKDDMERIPRQMEDVANAMANLVAIQEFCTSHHTERFCTEPGIKFDKIEAGKAAMHSTATDTHHKLILKTHEGSQPHDKNKLIEHFLDPYKQAKAIAHRARAKLQVTKLRTLKENKNPELSSAGGELDDDDQNLDEAIKLAHKRDRRASIIEHLQEYVNGLDIAMGIDALVSNIAAKKQLLMDERGLGVSESYSSVISNTNLTGTQQVLGQELRR